ncbi:MAG: DUF4097 family beta strand repeat protein [Candidatus Aminicenantes bacterium]|nr:DUF4097 family beta strand repeat protein [Candidatus Aminicenantes bacterium]
MSVRKTVLVAAAAALLASTAFAWASPPEQITVPLSRPGQPGALIVNHVRGNVTVIAYDGDAVVVSAAPAEPAPDRDGSAKGLTWVAAGEIRLSATESGNTVTVITNSESKTIDLRVHVPRTFNLKLSLEDNGRIEVDGVTGEMEVNNVNGHVRLDRVSGSALVSTVDGDIVCRFEKISPGLPLAFTSVYGKIDVAFPSDADLTVRMKTDQGSVFSDFEIALAPRKSLEEPAGKAGSRRISLEEWTSGKIGRGGNDVLLKTFEGNIYIRKVNKAGKP